MPNKCTRCGKIHPDDADYLLEGCDVCGSKFFFYIKEDNLKKAEETVKKLTKTQLKEIESDVREIISNNEKTNTKDDAVALDIEAINIKQPGKYEIDLVNLFNQSPLIIKLGTGKYKIDLSTLKFKWRK
ncbi:MAG: hypothetical protein DRN71_05740 [Candidatus Nanohalarchaeota archaeon]|nr:MAG: hypothetical protein DRN71_05740 [Candidatus Nanohaloarchaeota archaeon]